MTMPDRQILASLKPAFTLDCSRCSTAETFHVEALNEAALKAHANGWVTALLCPECESDIRATSEPAMSLGDLGLKRVRAAVMGALLSHMNPEMPVGHVADLVLGAITHELSNYPNVDGAPTYWQRAEP